MFTCVRRAESREAAGRVERPDGGHPAPLEPEHHAPPGLDAVRGRESRPAAAELTRPAAAAASARAPQLRAPDLAERAHQQHHRCRRALLAAEPRRELARDALRRDHARDAARALAHRARVQWVTTTKASRRLVACRARREVATYQLVEASRRQQRRRELGPRAVHDGRHARALGW